METNLKRVDRLKNLNFLVILILVISVFAIPVNADQEPNDSFAEAEEITEGTYEGFVNETDKDDYYKIELEPSTKITISFVSYAEMEQQLMFYNPSHDKIFSLYSNLETEETDEYYLANETEVDYWYVQVNEYWSGGGEYTFTVDLESQDDAGSGGDVVESYGDSYEINTGIDVNGFVGDLDEADMYKVELQPSSKVTVSFTSVAEMEQELIFYDPDKESSFSLYSSLETEATDGYNLANETEVDYWYVQVNEYWSGPAGYQFRINVESQDDAGSGNDVCESYSDAYEIDTDTEVNGFLDDLDETDMYKVELQPSSIVTLSFTSLAKDDLELKFYNPNKERLFSLYSSQETEESEDYYLANETEVDFWFIEVNQYWSEGDYHFSVNVDYQDDAGTGEDVASDDSEAYEIETDTTYGGYLNDLDQSDMYKIELEPSSIVTVSFTSFAEGDQELKFYNPNNEDVFSLYSSGESEETEDYYLANETEVDFWYIEINQYWSEGDYQFSVNVDYQDDAGTGEDVASEYSEAFEIENDTAYEGYLMDLDELDVYKIHLIPNSVITINFTADLGDELFLNFFNPNKEEEFIIYSSGGSKGTDSLNIGDEFEAGYWFIKIGASWGSGSYSFETHVITTSGPSPVAVSESSTTDTSITISWTENTDPDFFRYEIFLSTTEGETGYSFGFVSDQSETTYTLISLDPETTYYITVRVINTVEQTADSNQLEVTTDAGVEPPSPVTVTVEEEKENSIEISWTECKNSNFDRYEIYMSHNEGLIGDLIKTVDSRTTTSYEITGLDPETVCCISVKVVNEEEQTADSNQVTAETLEVEEDGDGSGDGTPGYTFILLLSSISLVLLYRYKKKRTMK